MAADVAQPSVVGRNGDEGAGAHRLRPAGRRRPRAFGSLCGRNGFAWIRTWFARIGVGRIPEETEPPADLSSLRLPALEAGGAVAQESPQLP